METEEEPKETLLLLRVFKHPSAKRADSIMVYEVEPTWQSLDENDVFVLERNDKIWVWQGKNCSPMEKAKAAQVVHDMTIAKHIDVEVLSQSESRSRTVVSCESPKFYIISNRPSPTLYNSTQRVITDLPYPLQY